MLGLVLAVVVAWTPFLPPMSIHSIVPAIGRPAGGEVIRIEGQGFRAPVRVLLNIGGPFEIEAVVVSISEDQRRIEFISPPILFGPGEQQRVVDVIVISDAGEPMEYRATAASGFTYRATLLEPRISVIVPKSGPVTGGTRVNIFGEGFEPPVAVFFGDLEARVIMVDYHQIIVESPAAAGPSTATVRVLNIGSQTSTDVPNGFEYRPNGVIHRVTPDRIPCAGDTRVFIEGAGFGAPALVTLAGVPATVIRLSGTRIDAIASRLPGTCTTTSGPVVVTDILSGDIATGATVTYAPEVPRRRSARH